VLLTTTYKPSKVMFHFIADLLEVRRMIQPLSLCRLVPTFSCRRSVRAGAVLPYAAPPAMSMMRRWRGVNSSCNVN